MNTILSGPVDFDDLIYGSSSSIVDGKSGFTASSITGERAYKTRRVPARGGVLTKIKVVARAESGVGSLTIDYPYLNNVQIVKIDSPNFKVYELYYQTPLTADANSSEVVLNCGLITGDEGTVIVADIIVQQNGSTCPSLSVLACGLLAVSGGSVSVNKSYRNSGIRSIDYSDEYVIRVEYSPASSENGEALHPLIFSNMTSDGLGEYYVKSGGSDRSGNSAGITIYDSRDGGKVKISEITTAYIWFAALGI